ncbi:hypothetical protein AKJ39_03075 [candidate division MSBL1 archaeon SCGC-AAA259J03]|uniref:Uncharacterized protein n=1 Tax=candidate division MSBL1 archaeon SCGC-AAA259J03 TaxID=1698269 RepID=A0A656YWK0_9EURY|nr:hypothetical protein AKJ39_03075 [candidate division MSBL1 archaeon SCGC-AAA259J03]
MKMGIHSYLSGMNSSLEADPPEPGTKGDPNQLRRGKRMKDRELRTETHVFSEMRGYLIENLHFPLSFT